MDVFVSQLFLHLIMLLLDTDTNQSASIAFRNQLQYHAKYFIDSIY
uniref:Uncharacterized protein n=1 Tax=Arundo donax TaxID=35708 RepID=A0A0A8Y6S3_ARUDO